MKINIDLLVRCDIIAIVDASLTAKDVLLADYLNAITRQTLDG